MALTPEEQMELAQLEAQYGAGTPAPQGGLTPEEQQELAQLEAQYGNIQNTKPQTEEGVWDKLKSFGGGAAHYGLRGLDYVGGLTRTGVAELPDLFNSNDVVQDGDWGRAFRGQAPSSADYLERLGVGEGGKLSELIPSMYSKTGTGLPLQREGWADPTLRGGGGFVADVALDPLTYVSMGAVPAIKTLGKGGQVVEKASKAISAATKNAGETMFRSGVKKIDEFAARYGKEGAQAPSEVFMKYGIEGSNKNIAKQAKNTMEGLKSQYDQIVQEASEVAAQSGAPVFKMKEALAPAQQQIDAVLNATKPDPVLVGQARDAQKLLDEYYKLDYAPAQTVKETQTVQSKLLDEFGQPMTKQVTNVKNIPETRAVLPAEAQKFKESLYKSLPQGAWDNLSRSQFGQDFVKSLSVGIKDQTENAVQMLTGRGSELNAVGQDLGTLLTSRKAISKEVGKENTRNLLSSVDGLAMGYSPKMFALKKGADLAKSTVVRTKVGSGLKKLGESQWLDPVVRQTLINNNREEPPAPASAWQSVRGF